MKRTSKTAWILFVALFLGSQEGCRRTRPVPEPESVLVPAGAVLQGAALDKNRPIRFAVIISVDGLSGEALLQLVQSGRLPTFSYLEQHGAWTREAVCDFSDSTTTANHTCMLTGLPSDPPMPNETRMHHGYHFNSDPAPGTVLHRSGNPSSAYIPSLFDVAHDFGLKTCLFSGKSKFVLFARSYDKDHGAPDLVGADNGRNKIDLSALPLSADAIAAQFREQALSSKPCELAFVHLAELDAVGHTSGWASEAWKAELSRLDGVLKKILDSIESAPAMKGKTAVIVTADHGGVGFRHGDPTDSRIFAVPFYVMGPGIPANTDLYTLYSKTKMKPGKVNPPYTALKPPIRGAEVGNFALSLLGLPPIPGSVLYGMNAEEILSTR